MSKITLYLCMLSITSCIAIPNLDLESIIEELKDPRPYTAPAFSKAMRWHQELMRKQFESLACRKMLKCDLYSSIYPPI